MLNPTPPDRLLDSRGRPYFLWDMDMTLEAFRDRLGDADPDVRAYFVAKLMRQAKPDDVFAFVSPWTIRESWSRIERQLGRNRPFWVWLLAGCQRLGPEWESPRDLPSIPTSPRATPSQSGDEAVEDTDAVLAGKLRALLGRTDLCDLEDVRALLFAGGDMKRALADAPRKDGGFSPLTLAWVLRGMPVERLAEAAGWSRDAAEALERFRDELVDLLLGLALPPSKV